MDDNFFAYDFWSSEKIKARAQEKPKAEEVLLPVDAVAGLLG